MKKQRYFIILLCVMLLASWGWFFYVNSKPKTSVDIVDSLLKNNSKEILAELVGPRTQMKQEDIQKYKSYFSNEGPSTVKQFSFLEYDNNDDVLLIQTTPGLENHQIYIQDIMTIDRQIMELILKDQ
ncbi:hypothetical protein ACFSTA_01925 [Ornithinibacillus salinisoli]|uniref:DUF3139 domain-containing protein n=1 Tax=Ornithinibacillus salinisoli TaxID=1848459 RepID=A0ABW4VWI1_9BACI